MLLSQFEWKSRDSPTETRLTDRYRSTDSLSFVTPTNFPRAVTIRRMANDVTYTMYAALPIHYVYNLLLYSYIHVFFIVLCVSGCVCVYFSIHSQLNVPLCLSWPRQSSLQVHIISYIYVVCISTAFQVCILCCVLFSCFILVCYVCTGSFRTAHDLYMEALQMFIQLYGPLHVHVANCYRSVL